MQISNQHRVSQCTQEKSVVVSVLERGKHRPSNSCRAGVVGAKWSPTLKRGLETIFVGSLLLGAGAVAQTLPSCALRQPKLFNPKEPHGWCGIEEQPKASLLCSASNIPSNVCQQLLPVPQSERHHRLERLRALFVEMEQSTITDWAQIAASSLWGLAQHGTSAVLTMLMNGRLLRWGGNDASTAAIVGASIGQMGYQSTHEILAKVFDVWKSSKTHTPEVVQRVCQCVQAESLNRVNSLPDIVQERISDIDSQIAAALQMKRDEYARLLLRFRQGILVSLPNQVHDMSHQYADGNPKIRACLDAAIEQLVQEYPQKIQPSLELLIAQIRANVFVKQPRRVQAYLQGPPGTGKTRFVHRLAQLLSLPLYEFSLKEDSTQEYLLGEVSSYGSYDPKKSDAQIVGQLIFGLIDTGIYNPIIFIDEAGEWLGVEEQALGLLDYRRASLFAVLKKILSPDKTTLSLDSFGPLPIDFSRATVIFAGNQPIKDAALLSRMQQIPFGPLDVSQKKLIAQSALAMAIEDNARLHQQDIDATRRLTEPLLEQILACDAAYQVPGARILKECIADLVVYVRNKVLDHRLPATEELQDLIVNMYRYRLLSHETVKPC